MWMDTTTMLPATVFSFISCSYSIFMISIDQYIFFSPFNFNTCPFAASTDVVVFIFSLMRFSECNSHTCLHFNRLSQRIRVDFVSFYSYVFKTLISLFEISTLRSNLSEPVAFFTVDFRIYLYTSNHQRLFYAISYGSRLIGLGCVRHSCRSRCCRIPTDNTTFKSNLDYWPK